MLQGDLFYFTVIIVLSVILGIFIEKQNVKRKRQDIIISKNNELIKTGEDEVFGSYHLRSFDGGRHWWNFSEHLDGDGYVNMLVLPAEAKLLERIFRRESIEARIINKRAVIYCIDNYRSLKK